MAPTTELLAPTSLTSTPANTYTPTVQLRHFVQALLSEAARGNKKAAARISGVDRGRFYHAMNHEPEFRQWYSDQCDRFLEMAEPVAGYNLVARMKKGDTFAIRTFYELRNKIKAPSTNFIRQNRITVIQQLHQLANGEPDDPAAAATGGRLQVVD